MLPSPGDVSIEGGDEFRYENVRATHFASAERRPRANNGMQQTAPRAAADADQLESQMKVRAIGVHAPGFCECALVRNPARRP